MKKLTPEQVKVEIQRRNSIFRGKTKAEKRVLIAQDVLDQLKIGRIKAENMAYLESVKFTEIYDSYYYEYDAKNPSVQKLALAGDLGTCNCCALGSMFLSCTLYNNKERISDIDHFTDVASIVRGEETPKNSFDKIFDKEQLKLIEVAFERGEGSFRPYNFANEELGEKAVYFGSHYKTASTRLRAIMKNIIKNKGEFIP